MNIKLLLLTSLLTIFVNSYAQDLPLVFEVENTVPDFPMPIMPSAAQLPAINNLPDPFEWSDGRGRIKSIYDWKYRRAQIAAEIQNYEIGEKPPRPDSIEASFSFSDSTLRVIVTENGKTLTLSSRVYLPAGTGPFPGVIGMGSPSGSIPVNILIERNIARITFNYNQVTTDGNQQNSDPYYQLYPHLNNINTGQYSAWAWGVSRLIDGLELVQDVLPIDLNHICVSGCSRGGKMAIFSGAFDERIALTVGLESGGGGYTTWRVSETLGYVETLSRTDYGWFRESMKEFSSAVSKLPEDHHELLAMVAPRALFVTGNPSQTWLADESGHVGSNAAKEVYNALGIPDRFGYSIVTDHPHCSIPASQIPEIVAFVEKFLLGDDTVTTNVGTTPFNTNLSTWITWTTPTLSNNPSNMKWTSLISPANLAEGLNKNVNFSWNKVEGAEKYLIQLSLDPTFGTIAITDSTADTVKTYELLDGKRYYWRVQVKNADGSSGPYSQVWNFTTYIPLPTVPESLTATPLVDRNGYITLTWKKADRADQYIIQFSYAAGFTSIFRSESSSDTVKTLGNFLEGRKYYWRLQAKNVAGTSSWSESDFLIMYAPTELAAQKNESNSITLTWEDNSSAEQGYIIERKQGEQTSFTLLDSLKERITMYTDSNVEQNQTYTYRIKIYKDSLTSEYSNEASLTLVSVNEDGIPTEFSVSQNFPNPFNPTTIIKFTLPQTALTKISVYNVLGKEIQVLLNEELEAGYHEVDFDAANFPSGVYFYRVQSGDFVNTRKMILRK